MPLLKTSNRLSEYLQLTMIDGKLDVALIGFIVGPSQEHQSVLWCNVGQGV